MERVLQLLLECAAAGYLDMEFRSMELRTMLGDPAFDTRRTRLCVGDNGDALGFAILWAGRYLGMLVHPDERGNLEPELLEWAAGHVRESSPRTAGPFHLQVLCRSDDAFGRDLLEGAGFALMEVEWRMGRPLDEPIPDATVPDGLTIRPLSGERELDEWLELYRESFPANAAHLLRWRRLRADRDWLPALDLVAVDSSGCLVGACACTIASAEASYLPVREGRTEPVMVRGEYQGRGVGRALVLTGLRLLREHGAGVAMLTTESDNDGAHRFYTRLGYQHVYDACWYGRDV